MLISVVIPCYNCSAYITECIESAYNQTYKNIEVICVDNNSTDNTLNILNDLKKSKYTGLIIVQETKSGAPAARNRGLSVAKGEWVQFLDADDIILPTKIERQVNLLGENSDVDNVVFIAGNCFYIQNNEKDKIPFYTFTNTEVWYNLIDSNIGCTCSNLFNMYFLNVTGNWNETQKSSQEIDLMFRLLKINENVIYDIEPLTFNLNRAGSITNSNIFDNLKRYIHIRSEIYNYLILTNRINKKIKLVYYKTTFYSILRLCALNTNEGIKIYDSLFENNYTVLFKILPLYKALLCWSMGIDRTQKVLQFMNGIKNNA